jgi:hypothetical protein
VPWRIVVTGVVFFLILVAGPALFYFLSPSAKVIATSIFRGESLHTIRLLGQRLMMLSGVSEASRARWPDPFSIYFFFPMLAGLRLDAADLACVTEIGFAFKWGVAVSVPSLAVLFSLAAQVWAAAASQRKASGAEGGTKDGVATGDSESLQRVLQRVHQRSRAQDIGSVAQAVIAVVTPFLAAHGIRPFVCSRRDDGEEYLVAESSLLCASPVVSPLKVAGAFVLVLALLAGAASLWWRWTGTQEDSGAVRALESIDFVVSVLVSVISEATGALTAKNSPVGLSLLYVLIALGAGAASILARQHKLVTSESPALSYTRSFFVTRVSAGICDIMVICVGLYLQAIRRHNVELPDPHLLALGWMLLLAALPHSISIVVMFGAAVWEAVTRRPFDWELPRRSHKSMAVVFGVGSFVAACVAIGTRPSGALVPTDAKLAGGVPALVAAFLASLMTVWTWEVDRMVPLVLSVAGFSLNLAALVATDVLGMFGPDGNCPYNAPGGTIVSFVAGATAMAFLFFLCMGTTEVPWISSIWTLIAPILLLFASARFLNIPDGTACTAGYMRFIFATGIITLLILCVIICMNFRPDEDGGRIQERRQPQETREAFRPPANHNISSFERGSRQRCSG